MLTGCENIRKKFTRKRKSKDSQEQMIIVPRDYSAHPFPSDVMYKQYFIYWKSWNQELITSLNDAASHKKIVDCVEQSIINLNKMVTYLNEEKAKELSVYVKKTEDLKKEIIAAKAMPPSRMTMLRYDAERILSSVNRLFDLRKMKEHLKM
jgi:dsDNA-binding SOS-regulon protein